MPRSLCKLFILFLALTVLVTGSSQTSSAGASSNFLTVPYYAQEKNYYCGPASVQMAISHLTGSAPSQDQLANELQIDHVKKITYTSKMRIPFDLRGFAATYSAGSMSVNELKRQNVQGCVVILLIWFEMPHTEYQHYVVVIGHNGTGVFINDPWSPMWSRPGRNTGPNVYVSDSDLEYLWSCSPSHWGLIIPYKPQVTTYTVAISVQGVPRDMSIPVTVDGTSRGALRAEEHLQFTFDIGTSHTVSVEKYVSGIEGIRYRCSSESLKTSSEGSYAFNYIAQYELRAESHYGNPQGSGWYDQGAKAMFSVTSPIPFSGFMGSLGAKIVFVRWSEDSIAITESAAVTMDSPKKVVAVWRIDATQAYPILSAIFVIAAAIAVVALIRRKKGITAPLSRTN